jgi:hypothetical protein
VILPVGGLGEDGAVLLNRSGLLATQQALRAIAIFAVGGSVRGPTVSGSVVLDFVLFERQHECPPDETNRTQSDTP